MFSCMSLLRCVIFPSVCMVSSCASMFVIRLVVSVIISGLVVLSLSCLRLSRLVCSVMPLSLMFKSICPLVVSFVSVPAGIDFLRALRACSLRPAGAPQILFNPLNILLLWQILHCRANCACFSKLRMGLCFLY